MKKEEHDLILIFVVVLFLMVLVLTPNQKYNEKIIQVEEDDIPKPFGRVSVEPDIFLDGEGGNIDSLDFWDDPDSEKLYLFITSKNSNLVQVWEYVSSWDEKEPLRFSHSANGVTVDERGNLLYIGLKSPGSVHSFSLPELNNLDVFGSFSGETNMDIFYHSNGETWIYVTENFNLFAYNTADLELLHTFSPPVTSMESVLADSFHGIIYVPDEQGAGGVNPGVHVYYPDGTPYLRDGTNVFGSDDIFQADEEGVALHRCFTDGIDNGRGFIIIADQIGGTTDFEFFDRVTWKHLGALNINGVGNTDGIATIERSYSGYNDGIFAAVHNDVNTALVSWETIFDATGLRC